jgi:peptide deformylase
LLSALNIAIWDDPILSAKCESVSPLEFGEELENLGKRMLITVGHNDSGIGLAAPQVGLGKRLFVMKCVNGTEIIAVNPKVFPKGEYKIMEEGCLSFPKLYGPVCRQDECTLAYQEPVDGKEATVELTGLDAHCAQHENDHLDGIMFFHRMPKHYRKKLLSQWEKMDCPVPVGL